MKKIIIIPLVLIITAAAVFAYIKYKQKTPDVVNSKPDQVIDAAGLIQAFEKDTANAAHLYIDHIVEVSGTVKRIDTSGSVVLGTEESPSEVAIGLDRRHVQDTRQLKVGSNAILQGICSGYSKAAQDPDDLLASLGTTVQLRSAGVKNKQ